MKKFSRVRPAGELTEWYDLTIIIQAILISYARTVRARPIRCVTLNRFIAVHLQASKKDVPGRYVYNCACLRAGSCILQTVLLSLFRYAAEPFCFTYHHRSAQFKVHACMPIYTISAFTSLTILYLACHYLD